MGWPHQVGQRREGDDLKLWIDHRVERLQVDDVGSRSSELPHLFLHLHVVFLSGIPELLHAIRKGLRPVGWTHRK